MISIIRENNDRELFDGAFLMINECVYYILYELINGMNNDEIDIMITELKGFLDNSDNYVVFNFVSETFCKILYYIVE